MANTKISQLTDVSPVQGGDIVPIVRSGSNFRISFPNFAENEVPSGVANGSTSLTLAHTPIGGVKLFINGLLQAPTTSYTITGATITLVSALNSTDTVLASYRY